MAYVNAACTGRVTIFSTGGKFGPVLNFTELHALTLAARSYALLLTELHALTLAVRSYALLLLVVSPTLPLFLNMCLFRGNTRCATAGLG